MAIPWLLLSKAEQRLPSSLSGLLVAGVPLVGAVIGYLIPGGTKLNRHSLLGLALGLIGVGVLLGIDLRAAQLGSAALVAVVAVGYAIGPVIYSRALVDLPRLGVVASSLAICAVGYAPVAITSPPSQLPAEAIWSVLALGLVCTALAFVLFFELIAAVGPIRATLITYINPAVAALAGAAVLGESIGASFAIGFLLILAGSYLARR